MSSESRSPPADVSAHPDAGRPGRGASRTRRRLIFLQSDETWDPPTVWRQSGHRPSGLGCGGEGGPVGTATWAGRHRHVGRRQAGRWRRPVGTATWAGRHRHVGRSAPPRGPRQAGRHRHVAARQAGRWRRPVGAAAGGRAGPPETWYRSANGSVATQPGRLGSGGPRVADVQTSRPPDTSLQTLYANPARTKRSHVTEHRGRRPEPRRLYIYPPTVHPHPHQTNRVPPDRPPAGRNPASASLGHTHVQSWRPWPPRHQPLYATQPKPSGHTSQTSRPTPEARVCATHRPSTPPTKPGRPPGRVGPGGQVRDVRAERGYRTPRYHPVPQPARTKRPHVQTSRPTPRVPRRCTSTPPTVHPTNPTGSPNRSGRPPGAGECQTYRQHGHRTPVTNPVPRRARTKQPQVQTSRPTPQARDVVHLPPTVHPTPTNPNRRALAYPPGPKEVTPSG